MSTDEEIMRELHEIRERMYEETKHMTPEQRMEYQKRDLEEQLAKLGITLKHVHTDPLVPALH